MTAQTPEQAAWYRHWAAAAQAAINAFPDGDGVSAQTTQEVLVEHEQPASELEGKK